MTSRSPRHDTDFGILLVLALGAFKAGLHAHMADAGFADIGPSFGYVFRILDGPSPSLAELAKRLGMTPQGALKIVSDMTSKGYVRRVDDPSDARVSRLVLAARGKQALAAARTYHAEYERDLRKQLGVQAVTAARAVLDAMAAEADSVEADVRPF